MSPPPSLGGLFAPSWQWVLVCPQRVSKVQAYLPPFPTWPSALLSQEKPKWVCHPLPNLSFFFFHASHRIARPLPILIFQAGAYDAFVGFAMHGSGIDMDGWALRRWCKWTYALSGASVGDESSASSRYLPPFTKIGPPQGLVGQLAFPLGIGESAAPRIPLPLSLTPVCRNAGRTKVFMDPYAAVLMDLVDSANEVRSLQLFVRPADAPGPVEGDSKDRRC
ncbi:hypothetical protein H6P81_021460 [Aristolochia fimbriata]|uniref:Uncharacterized protein n=1 Tax=Aristolochia fimbriata TaxID=158543 RepID=A0AAV7DUE6_ARIFI|nr:hypothetical protein H6P81_021460 [Aristolochia fimbriata]